MANLRVSYLNYADLATLTADPVATAAGPVTYLQNDARGDIFLASSTASQDIKLTWGGAAYTISQLTLWRHNLVYSDTVRLILYPNADWTGTPLYDPGATAAYVSGLFTNWDWGFTNRYFTPTASVKSAIIRVAASVAAFECARLYLGPYTEATFNPNYGFVLGQETNSTQGRSEGGSLRSVTKASWRTAAFDMMARTESDRAAWFEIGRYCDVSKAFVASLFPEAAGTSERDHTIFGKFEKAPGAKLSGINRYDFSMKILEL